MPVFRDLIAAHALQFGPHEPASHDAATGSRLLQAFALVGLVLQPGLPALARAAGVAHQYWVPPAIVATLLVAVVLMTTRFVRSSGGVIGLHPWREWTPRERLYLLTVAPLAIVVFGMVFREHFVRLAEAR